MLRKVTLTHLGQLVWLLVAANSCASILGVEDIEVGGAAGQSQLGGKGNAKGGATGVGGSPNDAGQESGGTAGAAGADAGSANAEGGTTAPSNGGRANGGSRTDAGAPNEAGAPSGGTTGEGGAAGEVGNPSLGGTSPSRGGTTGTGGTTSTTVTGSVIDFLGQKVPGVVVTLDGRDAITDGDGQFEFENAPASYDVSLQLSSWVLNRTQSYVWVYQGVTRRDPTLQVYWGLDYQSGNFQVINADGKFDTDHRTDVALGTPSGGRTFPIDKATQHSSWMPWYGPTVVSGRAHALRWSRDADRLPTAYESYQEQPFALTAESSANTLLTISLPDKTVTTGTITGSVTGGSTLFRQNSVYTRFTSDALFTLLNHSTDQAAFSYKVPALPNSVLTVAASFGDPDPYNGTAYGVVHQDVSPNADVQLTLPTAPGLSSPAANATNVSASTQFAWVSNAKVFLVQIEDVESWNFVYILTSQKQTKLPLIGGDLAVPSGRKQLWHVQVHGNWADMNAATGPKGFQDAFGMWKSEPDGKTRGPGSYAASEAREFTVK